MAEEKRKRGRPKLSEEEKERRRIERYGIDSTSYPTPPPMESQDFDGGKGGNPKGKVASEIIRISKAGWKAERVDMNDPEAIKERFDMYLSVCEERGIIPCMEGVYSWMGISRVGWWRILNGDEGHIKSDEVLEVMESIKTTMGEITSYAADASIINPTIGVLKLTNSFGYRDVKQVEHTNEVNVKIGGADLKTLEQKYPIDKLVIDTDYDVIETTNEDSKTS